MNPLARRIERLEMVGTTATFTLETVVLASYGDERACRIMARIYDDYCAGRLSGPTLVFYSALVNVTHGRGQYR